MYNAAVDLLQYGPVAQWSEQSAHNRLVAGSSPARPTIESPSEQEGFLFVRKWLVLEKNINTVLYLLSSGLCNSYVFGGKVDF